MSNILWLRDLNIAECAFCFGVLGIMLYKRQLRAFGALMGLLAVRALTGSILIPMLFFRKATGLSSKLRTNFFSPIGYLPVCRPFCSLQPFMTSIERRCGRCKVCRRLERSSSVGLPWFRWLFLSPSQLGRTFRTASFAGSIATMVSQIQQGTFVLTLCLLLFVCFAIRPLGLTFRSRIFGVTMGLGVTATAFLVQAAWISTMGAGSLYSPIYLVSTVGSLISVCVWGAYFVLPEPERQMILLPTTSPFFTWNRISEALGDEPGYVAIAGFKPQMLAAAELKVLSSTHKADRLPASVQSPQDALPRTALQQRVAVSQ